MPCAEEPTLLDESCRSGVGPSGRIRRIRMADAEWIAVLAGLGCLLFLLLWLTQKWQYLRLLARMQDAARQQFEEWRGAELGNVREQERQTALREARSQLQDWRRTEEQGIRQDAISRSQAVVTGKVTEHLAPYLDGFGYNPRDVRFIGSPVDLIIFDGLEDGRVREVVLVEIKTGASSLSGRQRQVRDAVRERLVSWREFRV
ncbi:MAG: Holliday junction resolvase [Armatimonadetes bacterium]|nr:Holliday junction resolvase [Armatimonadota bacterium]